MKVSISQLQEGCVSSGDVRSVTPHLLVKNGTVLTSRDIEMLEVFLIQEIDVSQYKEDGTVFTPMEQKKKKSRVKQTLFEKLYYDSVRKFQQLFYGFQNGKTLNIQSVRPWLTKCLNEGVRQPKELLFSSRFLDKPTLYLPNHAVSVAMLSAYLAFKMGYKKQDYEDIGMAGLLADIGMAKMPPSLLEKTSGLLAQERDAIHNHPIISYHLLRQDESMNEGIRLGAFQHHERIDGSGYPLQLETTQLHPYGKIVAVADVYHALTCDRSYRKGLTPFHVIKGMMDQTYGALDPQPVRLLLQLLMDFSIGTKVHLSNGAVAEIIYVDEHTLLTPLVRMVETDEIIPLQQKENLSIQSLC
ncbi:HD-GYP domain-containing protein [Aureibacillus halotolerans]|uniref:HD-GYP domain-containing protein (C-di-GMP phosphodiesterase class II) n=1 Tax=Aureibacillus halotolerans TaxID=1508390 RepID=A0A4R6U128_9BACI|nr:HD-GYP domain-containing protein [Aureibacillus halotolerans]TDQ38333.1 HD-GYP domain-containing protein (c-di-GMP phosphodiesterase class II) [Aureibacillus halotolerans]